MGILERFQPRFVAAQPLIKIQIMEYRDEERNRLYKVSCRMGLNPSLKQGRCHLLNDIRCEYKEKPSIG